MSNFFLIFFFLFSFLFILYVIIKYCFFLFHGSLNMDSSTILDINIISFFYEYIQYIYHCFFLLPKTYSFLFIIFLSMFLITILYFFLNYIKSLKLWYSIYIEKLFLILFSFCLLIFISNKNSNNFIYYIFLELKNKYIFFLNFFSNFKGKYIFLFDFYLGFSLELFLLVYILVYLIYRLYYYKGAAYSIELRTIFINKTYWLCSYAIISLFFISLINTILFIFLDFKPFFLFYNNYICNLSILFIKSLMIISVWILYYNKDTSEFWEDLPLLLFASLFLIFIAISSFNFLLLFISLEGLAIITYIMVVIIQHCYAVEAALKYFSIGGIGSAIMLLGISFIYGTFGSLDFICVKEGITELLIIHNTIDISYFKNINLFNESIILKYTFKWVIINLASIFLLFGFLFKLGIFPLHVWKPNVYEGTNLIIVAFFSLVINLAVFFILLRIFSFFFGTFIIWHYILLFSGLGSLLVGSIGALNQKKIKSFLAYTSINQMGYPLLALSLGSYSGVIYSFFFILVYVITTLLFFMLILNMGSINFSNKVKQKNYFIYLTQLRSLSFKQNFLKYCYIVVFGSMAGLPPFGGFFSKFFIIISFMSSGYYFTGFFVLIITIVSTYYYIKILKITFFEKDLVKEKNNSMFVIDWGNKKFLGLKVLSFCAFIFLVFFFLLLPYFFWMLVNFTNSIFLTSVSIIF